MADTIFLGIYHDTLCASITEISPPVVSQDAAQYKAGSEVILPPGAYTAAPSGQLIYRVYENQKSGQFAIVVINLSGNNRNYTWNFDNNSIKNVKVYQPFKKPVIANKSSALRIPESGLQILIAETVNTK